MNIIDTPHLPATYRLYQYGEAFFRIEVTPLGAGHRMRVELSDAQGEAMGPVLEEITLRMAPAEVDIKPLIRRRARPKKPASHTRYHIKNRLQIFDGEAWHDKGPLPENATAAQSELIEFWDTQARLLISRAARRHERHEQANSLLGF